MFCEIYEYSDGSEMCVSESFRTVYVSPIQPPFLYNNQCTSTILTRFIPVYVFMYAIQFVVTLFLATMLTLVRYNSIPHWMRKVLPGVFWPYHDWDHDNNISPRDMLKTTQIISFDILNHLTIFITFGIACPYLALILLVAVTLKLSMWRLIISRFVYERATMEKECVNKNSSEGKNIVLCLSSACEPISDLMEDNLRPIISSSALFYAVLCWDVVGDEVGLRYSLWAPVSVLALPAIVWVIFLFRQWRAAKLEDDCVKKEDELDSSANSGQANISRPSVNPLHIPDVTHIEMMKEC